MLPIPPYSIRLYFSIVIKITYDKLHLPMKTIVAYSIKLNIGLIVAYCNKVSFHDLLAVCSLALYFFKVRIVAYSIKLPH